MIVSASTEPGCSARRASESIAIGVTTLDTGAVTVSVYVMTEKGRYYLGSHSASVTRPTSIHSWASCPGAVGWYVEAENSTATDLQVQIIEGTCCASVPVGVGPAAR